MPVPAANIVFVVLAHIGGPLLAIPSPDRPLDAVPPPPRELTISIADNHSEVSGGERIKYRITVTNPTESEAPVTVRLTLPSAELREIHAEDAAIVANALAWKNRIPAGETRTYSAIGVVAADVASPALEATACLHLGAETPALACVSDRNEVIGQSRSRQLSWLAAILFGILAVVGAVWLQRKIHPEPLTRFTAADLPEQPGGAPSA